MQSNRPAVKVSDLVSAASSTVASRRSFVKVRASDLLQQPQDKEMMQHRPRRETY